MHSISRFFEAYPFFFGNAEPLDMINNLGILIIMRNSGAIACALQYIPGFLSSLPAKFLLELGNVARGMGERQR